jgi:hypothetical protein
MRPGSSFSKAEARRLTWNSCPIRVMLMPSRCKRERLLAAEPAAQLTELVQHPADRFDDERSVLGGDDVEAGVAPAPQLDQLIGPLSRRLGRVL